MSELKDVLGEMYSKADKLKEILTPYDSVCQKLGMKSQAEMGMSDLASLANFVESIKREAVEDYKASISNEDFKFDEGEKVFLINAEGFCQDYQGILKKIYRLCGEEWAEVDWEFKEIPPCTSPIKASCLRRDTTGG